MCFKQKAYTNKNLDYKNVCLQTHWAKFDTTDTKRYCKMWPLLKSLESVNLLLLFFFK